MTGHPKLVSSVEAITLLIPIPVPEPNRQSTSSLTVEVGQMMAKLSPECWTWSIILPVRTATGWVPRTWPPGSRTLVTLIRAKLVAIPCSIRPPIGGRLARETTRILEIIPWFWRSMPVLSAQSPVAGRIRVSGKTRIRIVMEETPICGMAVRTLSRHLQRVKPVEAIVSD